MSKTPRNPHRTLSTKETRWFRFSLHVLRLLGLLVLEFLPRHEASDVAAEVVLVDVVVELLHADLGVGLGLLHVGVHLLADGKLDLLFGMKYSWFSP